MDDVQDSNEPAEPSKAIPDRKFSVLEALSATGLRAIRYAKEIDGLGTIIANDIEAQAVENIRRNVLHNDLSVTKVLPNCADAAAYMYENRGTGKFDIIDLVSEPSVGPPTHTRRKESEIDVFCCPFSIQRTRMARLHRSWMLLFKL